ncbi:MAG: N-(5-phosphoribosyl)anthranilate isomerase, partial [Alphaproteobacteria bacterium]|nr:N-(5-phosphoribosyl)anthranilate isomerase [Alphaproteobacteria bacterium]
LTPDNVARAVVLSQAAFVDVSSGVESAPGVKDAARILQFVNATKHPVQA